MSTSLPLPDSPHPGAHARQTKHSRKPLPLEPSKTLPILQEYFDALILANGEQNWWPSRDPFEVIVGAILVQNTAWINAKLAILNLREAGLLTPAAVEKTSLPRLARLIRSSGYYRQKARKLKAFVAYLRKRHNGSFQTMFRTPTMELREQLLQVHGIGPETADCILLYAGHRPVFVVDAYARRILKRHGLAHGNESYELVRGLFEKSLPNDPKLFNEFHALIVRTGKLHCRNRAPVCSTCALRPFLPQPVEGSR
jgi:endonuclease III related protein